MVMAERIKELRRKNKLNQEELADKVNISPMTVRRWEWGQRTPRTDELQRLASALNTTSAYLLGETDDPAPSGQTVQQLTLPEVKTSEPVQTPSYKDFSTTTSGNLIYESSPTEASWRYRTRRRTQRCSGI